MNDTLETIYKRRSIRKFKDNSPDRKTIETLIDAGRMAPTAINQQEWKFYVLTDREKIKALSKEIIKAGSKGLIKEGFKNLKKIFRGGFHLSQGIDFIREEDPVFHSAPIVIFITAPRNNEWAGLDIGMCCENMMLAATSMGLATCPVGFGKFVMQTPGYPLLNIPDDEIVHIAIAIGYGDETPEMKERRKDNIIFVSD